MKREDIKEMLGESCTEEQISNLLNMFHKATNESKKQLEDLTNKINSYSDYDQLKSKLNEYEQASMTEQQRLEAEKEQIAKNLRESKIILNTTKAKNILAGYDLDDDTISMLVREDENATLTNANKLKEKMDNLKVVTEKQVQERLVKVDVSPSISNVVNDAMTWDKFNNMSAEEQNRFVEEHPNEFANL